MTDRARRLDLEVRAELDWPAVDSVLEFASTWVAEHVPGVWELRDVARFDVGEGVRWMVGFAAQGLSGAAAVVPSGHPPTNGGQARGGSTVTEQETPAAPEVESTAEAEADAADVVEDAVEDAAEKPATEDASSDEG